jgi:hypothetical protein
VANNDLVNLLAELDTANPDALNQEQRAALDYLDAHRSDVETEYQQVVAQAEENRQYWEARNQERFARIAAKPGDPEHAALRLKLQAWKAQWQSNPL